MPEVAVPLPPTDTVTVRSVVIADAAVAVTVTITAVCPSVTLDGFTDSVTAGLTSSSASVTVAPVTVVFRLLPATPMVSLPSLVVSWIGFRVNVPVPLSALAAMVTSKLDTAA